MVLLFDLDGTLLGMDEEQFVRIYMKSLAAAMAEYGYEPRALIGAVAEGEQRMRINDGTQTNETIVLDLISKACGKDARKDIPLFESFYRGEGFQKAASACHTIPGARELIADLKAQGCRLILASNPLFPKCAMEARLSWAGLDPQDFEWITSYETSSFSKSDPRFFTELAERLAFDPKDAVMIGNSPQEDGNAAKAGMQVFLFDKEPDFETLKTFLKENACR